MGQIYYIVIPVVIVVVMLKLCIIFWRIWLYQKRRERVYIRQPQIRVQPQQPTARIIGVERTLGPEGYTQRTAYVINERGLPPRTVTRTVTIRPRETGRPQDPNMPPTYDQAVTGKDKSVKVNAEAQQQIPTNPPPPPTQGPVPSAPSYSRAPPPSQQTASGLPPPPAYTLPTPASGANPRQDEDNISLDVEDTTRLLA